MKLLIDIPPEFESHFQSDKFEDSLWRLQSDAHLMAGRYERELTVMLVEAFAKAIPAHDIVDAVEVIRCRDCDYFKDRVCDRWADGTLMCPDDYCSRALRAEEER